MRAPSTPCRLSSEAALSGLTLPPYCMTSCLSRFLVEHLSEAAPNEGVRVLSLLGRGVVSGLPIAQTGSYAMVRRLKVSADTPANPW